ncbi:hypothetical protein Salat_0876900 [Sesamum alatum]|uniref:Uncharacterized protein n=1 Tax=Sesamum alatum TaxID=300844 RepID=A0AAE2CQV3_9LAMI|nr:hypothetical protein Salat_0876900 [Sesamum alatum]
MDEELLIVAGLHPAPDRYKGPLDRFTRLQIMMNRAAVRKFIPEDVTAMPSSSGTRSTPSTPSDLPPELTPSSSTPPPASVNPEAGAHATPIIEVVTSPEDSTPLPVPSEVPTSESHPPSPMPLPIEDLPSSHKRPRTSEEGAEGTPLSVGRPSEFIFPALVLTPRLDPQARAFNMSRTVNRADVEALATHTYPGLENFVLAQASIIPVAITTMTEKYANSLRVTEMLRRELNEAYTRGREEGAASAVALFKESPEYAIDMYHQASAFYIDGFATCLAQFKNVGNLPLGFNLSFVNV